MTYPFLLLPSATPLLPSLDFISTKDSDPDGLASFSPQYRHSKNAKFEKS